MLLPDLEAHILLLHQRSKFGLIIEYVELILHILDHRMLTGHRNISDPDLAFVSSSDFYTLLWSVLDHHYALFLLACALQDQVVACWLIYADHFFDVLRAFGGADLHVTGELASADLTLKLGEVVMQSTADYLFLDLDADPLGQALEMDRPTRPVALTGIEQEIGLFVVIF